MTYFKNDPRTLSLADGTVATGSNNAAPDAMTVNAASSGVVRFRDVAGSKYWEYDATAGASAIARMGKAVSTTQAAAEVMFNFVGLTAGLAGRLLALWNSGASGGMAVAINPDGTLKLTNFAGATLWTSPVSVMGKRVRVFHGVKTGTGTADGEIHLKCYFDADADGTTPTSGWTYDSTTANAGAAANPLTDVRVGKDAATAAGLVKVEYLHFNDTQVTNVGLGPLAAPTSNAAPTANAGPDQTDVEPWSTVTLTGTDSDSDGTIASRSWTQTGGPAVTLTGSGAARTFEAPATVAGTTLTFQYSATDDGGATTTDTMTVTVLPAAERILIGGTWVPARWRVV